MGFTLANQRSLPPRGLKGVAFSGALVGTALEAGVEGGEGRGMGETEAQEPKCLWFLEASAGLTHVYPLQNFLSWRQVPQALGNSPGRDGRNSGPARWQTKP